MDKPKSLYHPFLLWGSRILFGALFIFSGFVKAIDPLGSAYKFQDYFLAFNTEWLFPTALPLSVFMSSLEFIVGVAILLGIKIKLNASLGVLFMLFFTPLTLYIAIYDPVPDCGCFGDALIVTNWETFYKNVFLLAAAVYIYVYRYKVKPLWSEKKDGYLLALITLLIVWLSVYCLRNLPIIDFRAWKVGNNVEELLTPVQEEEAVFTFVYEHEETGRKKEFGMDELPSAQDGWKFVDRKKTVIKPFIGPPIEDFMIQDAYGDDYTEVYVGNPDYQFLVIAYDLNRTRKSAFTNKINRFAEQAEQDGYSLIVLTGSSYSVIDAFRHEVQTPYPFYQSDEIELKTIVRANPGMLLMKDWRILGKWHHRNIPDYEQVKKKYMQNP